MKLLALPGHWYCDARPDGAYVASRFGARGVQTDAGIIEGPALQWTRIGPDLRFAGTGATDANAWEWTGRVWANRGPFVAPRAVLYQADGSLQVERAGAWPGPGSQGWRYVDDDGSLVPAWSTYADGARQIYEYTTRGDVTIGQGNGGVEALIPGKRIRLDRLFPGLGDLPACFAVIFNRDGDRYAVAWYVAHSPTNYTACFVWLTDAELRALPSISVTPAPNPVPVPQPPPEPKSMEGLTDVQFATLQAVRARYGVKVSPVEIGAILNETAWIHRNELGMQGKPGNSTVQPRTGIPIWNGLWIKRGGKDYGQDVLGAASVGLATAVRGEVYVGQPDVFTFVPPVLPLNAGAVPATTHRYDGGGNDTGECDICHFSRFDPVHRIPESLVQHQYDGGEQDTGLCDVCQQERRADIHQEVLPGPAPDPTPTPSPNPGTLAALEARIDGLLDRIELLEARPAFSGKVRIAAIDLTLEGK